MAPFSVLKEPVEREKHFLVRWWVAWVAWGVGTVGNDRLMFIAGEHVLSDWLCDEPQSEMAERQ